jgi:aryl-phospho-beta-D-glucosidase BglC (GH1 family)
MLTFRLQGSDEQKARLQRSFDRKVEFMRRVGGPIWNGEFGPVYQNAEDGLPDWQEINKRRYHVLEDQLDLYDKAKASWSIWLWKDIGFQGMVYVGEETPYIKMLKPFLEKKKVSIRSVKTRRRGGSLIYLYPATCFG